VIRDGKRSSWRCNASRQVYKVEEMRQQRLGGLAVVPGLAMLRHGIAVDVIHAIWWVVCAYLLSRHPVAEQA